jgi:hypothetical protein
MAWIRASHMVINVYNGTNRYNPTLPANLISLHVLIHVHFENARKGTRGIECLKFDKMVFFQENESFKTFNR